VRWKAGGQRGEPTRSSDAIDLAMRGSAFVETALTLSGARGAPLLFEAALVSILRMWLRSRLAADCPHRGSRRILARKTETSRIAAADRAVSKRWPLAPDRLRFALSYGTVLSMRVPGTGAP